MTEPYQVTGEQRARFLEVLAEHANVGEAVRASGLPRRRALSLRAADEDFAADWDAAIEDARDRLELAAWTRALDGVEEPYFYGGQERGTLRRHPDGLLQMLLKAERPEKFGDAVGARSTAQRAPVQGRPEQTPHSGVLVVPGPADPQEWVEEAKKHHRRLTNGGPG